MDGTNLYGEPLPPPPAPPEPKVDRRKYRTAQDKEGEKRSNRTAAFYERLAPEAHPAEISFRHSGWRVKREKVFAALKACGKNEVELWNFNQCGACCTCEWSEELGRRRLSAYYCRNRHCEPCGRAKANKIRANLEEKLKGLRPGSLRLLTFTLKHYDAPLREQVDRLYASFKKLRATKEWKKSQKGGVVILEVKHNGKHWHPHLHCCSEGSFIKKQVLVDLWHKVTGDSYIVDVKLVDRGKDAAAYVCKYITKSTEHSVWNTPDRAQEWIVASRGIRSANTFGSWRKLPLLKMPKKVTDWKVEQKLTKLIWLAREGDQVSYDILESLLSMRCNEECSVPPNQFPVADQGDEAVLQRESG